MDYINKIYNGFLKNFNNKNQEIISLYKKDEQLLDTIYRNLWLNRTAFLKSNNIIYYEKDNKCYIPLTNKRYTTLHQKPSKKSCELVLKFWSGFNIIGSCDDENRNLAIDQHNPYKTCKSIGRPYIDRWPN